MDDVSFTASTASTDEGALIELGLTNTKVPSQYLITFPLAYQQPAYHLNYSCLPNHHIT